MVYFKEEDYIDRADFLAQKKIGDYSQKPIYVFPTNELGLHPKEYIEKGAIKGMFYGRAGNTFAIPVKDCYMETLPEVSIGGYIAGMLSLSFALYNTPFVVDLPDWCAGYLRYARHNIFLPISYLNELGVNYKYWEK